jgi:hypothetical protein
MNIFKTAIRLQKWGVPFNPAVFPTRVFLSSAALSQLKMDHRDYSSCA